MSIFLSRESNMAETDNPPEMIIVLGSHTNDDGSPTDMMKSRVNKGAELHLSLKQQRINCRVIVTGYQRPQQVMDKCQSFCYWCVISLLGSLCERPGRSEGVLHYSLIGMHYAKARI